jgi:hypothetical protein
VKLTGVLFTVLGFVTMFFDFWASIFCFTVAVACSYIESLRRHQEILATMDVCHCPAPAPPVDVPSGTHSDDPLELQLRAVVSTGWTVTTKRTSKGSFYLHAGPMPDGTFMSFINTSSDAVDFCSMPTGESLPTLKEAENAAFWAFVNIRSHARI